MSMQECHFDQAFERIKTATNTRTQVELAAVLDIRQSSISDAKRRNSVPAEWLMRLFECFGLNPFWVKYGTGSQYLTSAEGGPLVTHTQPDLDAVPVEQLLTAIVRRFPAGWNVCISRPDPTQPESERI